MNYIGHHKSGFVNIVGLPNVGKSSLINMLIEEPISIINAKTQTTRQNIKGFINGDDYQIVLVDTPGYIDTPSYQLQLNMNSYIDLALEESDVLLLVVDKFHTLAPTHPLIQEIKKSKKPVILIINKADETSPEELMLLEKQYKAILDVEDTVFISVHEHIGRDRIIESILNRLPFSPPYYEKDEYTDKNLRFMVSEIVREKILSNYDKEIPYSSEVVVTKFKEKENSTIIEATIYVERLSQKKIIIGHEAKELKKISIKARNEIEDLLETKVHLFLFVKVLENWRNKPHSLKKFGYHQHKNPSNE